MSMFNPYQSYQTNQVNTASGPELTLMLYNGMIKFIKQAKLAIENKEFAKANELIIRGQDILTELLVTLNMDYDISKQLSSLYDYMKRRLVEANIHKDLAILSEVEGMAVELKDTWAQAMKLAKSG